MNVREDLERKVSAMDHVLDIDEKILELTLDMYSADLLVVLSHSLKSNISLSRQM